MTRKLKEPNAAYKVRERRKRGNAKRKYSVIIEKDKHGWLVSEVVGLPGCHTQAHSLNQLLERTREAIEGYLEEGDNGDVSVEFIGIQQLEV